MSSRPSPSNGNYGSNKPSLCWFPVSSCLAPASPERQLLHLVVLLISQDFELLVELPDERLAVLQVARQFPLALRRLAALCSRHVLDTGAGTGADI